MASPIVPSLLIELLASWDRQSRMLLNLASLVDDGNRHAKPSPSGWPIDEHLCHVHETRYHWLGKVSPSHQEAVGDVLRKEGEEYVPIEGLDEIRRQLGVSARAVRDAVEQAILDNADLEGPYSHPLFFLQHMVWHEGYHFSLILLALRNAGIEPSQDWEEEHVWGLWRSVN